MGARTFRPQSEKAAQHPFPQTYHCAIQRMKMLRGFVNLADVDVRAPLNCQLAQLHRTTQLSRQVRRKDYAVRLKGGFEIG